MTEITPSFIYWITRLDGINIFFHVINVFSTISLIIFIIILIFLKLGNDRGSNAYHISIISKCFKLATLICLISSMLLLFIPSTKEMCAMYVIPKIANSEEVKNVGKEFYDLALDWMKELHPNKVRKEK